MKFAYDKSKAQHIINHEDIMLKTYSKIISTYTSLFEQYDCSLKVRLFWINFSTERRSNRRLPFRIGYACQVCCEVQRDGKEVQVKSADGEADYYSLSATWMVSSIERSFLKAKASLYSDTDDIENDMKELFRLLSNDQQNMLLYILELQKLSGMIKPRKQYIPMQVLVDMRFQPLPII